MVSGSYAIPCTCGSLGPEVMVNGVRIGALSMASAVTALETCLSCKACHVVHHIPAHPIALAQADPDFRDLLNRARLNLPDGMGVVWALSLLGQSAHQRVYGGDFLLAVAEWGTRRGLRHGFIGGSSEVRTRLISMLRSRFPGIAITSDVSPPFREVSADTVAEDLATLSPDIDVLWVGLGTPKQQLWADIASKSDPARVILTIGAAFDFLSGMKPRAPAWIQRCGLEWAFRLASEPRRLWRREILDNGRFAYEFGRSQFRMWISSYLGTPRR
jgi:N-acetylglucosaminyldiphosphoundecaprenol N-acetyl-beta-D-mannosaminyltransferase